MKDICPQCNNEFELNKNQIRNKNKGKLVFCSIRCSGKYYANKQHKEETAEQKQQKANKISNTLKQKETKLTEEQKQQRVDNLNKYWANYTSEQRSAINKTSAIKGKRTKLERYGNATYNNREKCKQTNLEKYGVDGYARSKMYFDDKEYKDYLDNITELSLNSEKFSKEIKRANKI